MKKQATLLSTLAALSLVLVTTSWAQSTTESATTINEAAELKLPEDLAAKANQDQATVEAEGSGSRKYEVIERRINGRLERVTVLRANGLDEIYENREVDSMFSKEADELGEVQNVRRWTLGTW